MSTNPDPNALLLQVMAHDLLAPLTAVKWQTELLGRGNLDAATYQKYLHTIEESTQLGISLTKHAHVAGRMLVGSYEQTNVPVVLSTVIDDTLQEMYLQYERHGITLETQVNKEVTSHECDVELVRLFVWALAKFFLSCAPANTAVSVQSMSVPGSDGTQTYVLMASAAGIPEAEECVQIFGSQEARSTYDQSYVFAKLLHETAPLIGVSPNIYTQTGSLVFEASFA